VSCLHPNSAPVKEVAYGGRRLFLLYKSTADVYIKDVLMNTDEGDVEMKYNA
jgi:hypothetical protein